MQRWVVADEVRGAFHGGMQVVNGDLSGAQKAAPGAQDEIGEAGVECAGVCGGFAQFGQKIFEPFDVWLGETAAGILRLFFLQEGGGVGVNDGTADSAAAENGDPHFEIGGLLEEDVLLRGEEPKEVATADLIAAIAEQIGAGAADDEVEFELGVGVADIL